MSLSHDIGPVDVPLLRETIGQNLETTAAAWPEEEALVSVHQGVRLTYRMLDWEVNEVAEGLMAAGLEKGDRLGIWSPNRYEWVLIQYATAKIGVILVNINPAYRTTELVYALNQSGCRMLIAAESFKTSDYRAMIDEVRADLPDLETVIFLGSPEWHDLVADTTITREMLRARMDSLDPDDPINIQYTSGTTGFPKGATLTHTNILNNGYFTGNRCGYTHADRICIPVPFYHCFGMVLGNLAATTHGATMVIPGEAFDAEEVLRTVQEERCTSLYGVPTMFIAEFAHPDFDDFDLGTLRTGIMAGSPCPIEVMRQVVDRMGATEMTIAYGMTETSPVSTQTTADDSIERRTTTVGRVHPHVEIKIVDPELGSTMRRGEAGEFCTRGYSVMQGYWNDPERTREVIGPDGYLHSGDLATMDEEGYVNIVGRIKDMIIRGGENIYPREIEEYLFTHPHIEDVQVIGVPSERYGEEVMAWVKPRAGADIDEESVKDFCRGRIAHFKVPSLVRFVDEFPMTVTGKVQKFRMRDMAKEELGLDEVETA